MAPILEAGSQWYYYGRVYKDSELGAHTTGPQDLLGAAQALGARPSRGQPPRTPAPVVAPHLGLLGLNGGLLWGMVVYSFGLLGFPGRSTSRLSELHPMRGKIQSAEGLFSGSFLGSG